MINKNSGNTFLISFCSSLAFLGALLTYYAIDISLLVSSPWFSIVCITTVGITILPVLLVCLMALTGEKRLAGQLGEAYIVGLGIVGFIASVYSAYLLAAPFMMP